RGDRVPGAWVDALAGALRSPEPEVVRQAVRTARVLDVSGGERGDALAKALLNIAADGRHDEPARLDALAAVPGGLDRVPPEVFDLLTAQFEPERPADSRRAAIDVLLNAALDAEQLTTLAGALPTVGPVAAGRLLGAFAGSEDVEVGRALV